MSHNLAPQIKAIHASRLLGGNYNSGSALSIDAYTSDTIDDCYLSTPPVLVTIHGKANVWWLGDIHKQFSEVLAAESVSTVTTSHVQKETVSAFRELEETRADDSNFLRALAELRREATVPEHDILANRLDTLLEAYQEDYGQSLDVDSLRSFISFMSLHPRLNRPILTATPDGNLFAEWKDRQSKHYLAVQFLPTGQLRYVAIRQNPQHMQARIRSSGILTGDQLLNEIASHDVLNWAGRKD